MSVKAETPRDFYSSVVEALRAARASAWRAVNLAMVGAFWNVGRMIIEEEQQGRERAEYGAALIRNLSVRLTAKFGKGFTESNLWNFRQFYMAFPDQAPHAGKLDALRRELTWAHCRHLMRVGVPAARAGYLRKVADQNWRTRVLQRQINTLYYERLRMSRDKAPVIEEMQALTAPIASAPNDFIKDTYVLVFLSIPDPRQFREFELEQANIDKFQNFMLVLGKGFAFVSRQYRASTETKEFYINLVFYNYLLSCFVLIDLKSNELTHQDIGQMNLYVRLFEDTVRGDGDNPTVGLVLCTSKDHTVAKYSVLDKNRQLFASKYRLYLPSKEELRA